MTITVYVDGAGGSNSGYGYFVKETGETFYKKEAGISNNQAEYLAILSVLERFQDADDLIIYSDSKNTVMQLNHQYAINNDALRNLAMKAWQLIPKIPKLQIVWIPRKENLAGKMLGS